MRGIANRLPLNALLNASNTDFFNTIRTLLPFAGAAEKLAQNIGGGSEKGGKRTFGSAAWHPQRN